MSEFLENNVDKQLSPWRDFFSRKRQTAEELKTKSPDLAWLLSREDNSNRSVTAKEVFAGLGLPSPTTDFRRHVDPRVFKFDGQLGDDGQVVVYRGDIPGLAKKGMYSTEFINTLATLDQIIALQDSEYGNPFFTKEQLLVSMMGTHSQAGGEPFISTTGRYEVAREWADRRSGVVYVISVPIERIMRNIYSKAGDAHFENEYLINDYILPDAIIEER